MGQNKSNTKLDSGSEAFNTLLNGGYEKGIITTLYGASGTGKTTAAMLACISAAKSGKAIFIDTESGFSAERLSQLSGNNIQLMERIVVFKPSGFYEQARLFRSLLSFSAAKLVVVDTISTLYRLEAAKSRQVKELNKDLAASISYLSEFAAANNTPVILTSQVYDDFENPGQLKIVGGDIVSYASKCLISLSGSGLRKAAIKKHRSIKENKEVLFRISEKGFIMC